MSLLAIDLYCGLGGWTEGFLAEGYEVVGFDIERHVYGSHQYPAQLVLQDVMTLHGSQFKDAACIVASPPCQEYSYMAMPWSRAKQIAKEYREGTREKANLTALFDACFRIQREASQAAGHHVPLVVENVCGAQKWVGRARWHFGSYYLWGDVPALMPFTEKAIKVGGNLKFYHPSDPRHVSGQSFNTLAARQHREAIKNGGDWFAKGEPWQSERSRIPEGVKQGGGWFHDAKGHALRKHSSHSTARKVASARIAKIPLALAIHIARVYHPSQSAVA